MYNTYPQCKLPSGLGLRWRFCRVRGEFWAGVPIRSSRLFSGVVGVICRWGLFLVPPLEPVLVVPLSFPGPCKRSNFRSLAIQVLNSAFVGLHSYHSTNRYIRSNSLRLGASLFVISTRRHAILERSYYL